MRALLVALLLASACHSSPTLLVLTVEKGPDTPATVASVTVDLTFDDSQKMASANVGAPPTVTTFQIRHGSGHMNVSAIAKDASGAALQMGSTEVNISGGATTRATVTLGINTGDNDGGIDLDGGTPDLAAPTVAQSLFAIHPSLAAIGQTIALEGDFGVNNAVHFPGGAIVNVTGTAGAHHLTVKVPDATTAGTLTVVSDNVTSNALSFRKAGFALGFSGSRSVYSQTYGARQMPSLSTLRSAPCVLVTNDRVFVLGGDNDNNTSYQSIEQAFINADGSLGAFSDAGSTMVAARKDFGCAVIAGAVWVFGGGNGTTAVSTTERAVLNADGSLGAFTTNNTIASPRFGASYAVVGNYVYMLGGVAGTTASNVMSRAAIDGNGVVGAFTDVGTIDSARGHAGVVVSEGNLYLIGGYANSNPVATVAYAPIGADGTLGTWVPGSNLLTGAYQFDPLVVGNTVYIVESTSGGSVNVESIPISTTNGTLGTPTGSAGHLASSRTNFRFAVVGNYAYVIGGSTSNTTAPTAPLEVVDLIGGGGFATPADYSLLPAARYHHAEVTIGNKLYLIGGNDGSGPLKTIVSATVAPDGTLGAFTDAGIALNTAREGHVVVVTNGFVYAMGGTTDRSIERAPITGGTLGAFVADANQIAQARTNAGAIILANMLYYLGDYTGVANTAGAESTSLHADGSINGFQEYPTDSGLQSYQGFTLLTLSGSAYYFGGTNNGTLEATVASATWNYDGSFAGSPAFTPFGALVATTRAASVLLGPYVYVIGGNGSTGTLGTASRALVGGSAVSMPDSPALTLSAPREQTTAISLGDYVYLLGGLNGTAALPSVQRAPIQ